jgi:ankyrin repeat protein
MGYEWPLRTLIFRQQRSAEVLSHRSFFSEHGIQDIDWRAPLPLGQDEYLRRLDYLLTFNPDLKRLDGNGLTVLAMADLEASKLLIRHGADVNLRNLDGETALFACGTTEKARLLVENGADINAMRTGATDYYKPKKATVLQWHAWRTSSRDADLIETLLELGANPLLRDGDGRSILFYCDTVAELVRFLEYGLDPLERASDGKTLLHTLASAWGDNLPIMTDLIARGLDLNAQDDQGQTVLHIIAGLAVPQSETIEKLIFYGVDKSIRDNANKRAFNLTPKSRTAIREMLR